MPFPCFTKPRVGPRAELKVEPQAPSQTQLQSASSKAISFLDLPYEIRLQIYQLLLDDATMIEYPKPPNDWELKQILISSNVQSQLYTRDLSFIPSSFSLDINSLSSRVSFHNLACPDYLIYANKQTYAEMMSLIHSQAGRLRLKGKFLYDVTEAKKTVEMVESMPWIAAGVTRVRIVLVNTIRRHSTLFKSHMVENGIPLLAKLLESFPKLEHLTVEADFYKARMLAYYPYSTLGSLLPLYSLRGGREEESKTQAPEAISNEVLLCNWRGVFLQELGGSTRFDRIKDLEDYSYERRGPKPIQKGISWEPGMDRNAYLECWRSVNEGVRFNLNEMVEALKAWEAGSGGKGWEEAGRNSYEEHIVKEEKREKSERQWSRGWRRCIKIPYMITVLILLSGYDTDSLFPVKLTPRNSYSS